MPPIVALAQIVVEFRKALFGEEAVDPDPARGRISGGQPFDVEIGIEAEPGRGPLLLPRRAGLPGGRLLP